MKQEYTDKMRTYQESEYENFLKEKCVLDARQFLNSSLLYLNYALITAKLYEDIGKKNITESNQNPMHNTVEVLGWNYDAHRFLNKLTLEWISHIGNSLDCLLQYVNSALNLGLQVGGVTKDRVIKELSNNVCVKNAIEALWTDDTINYIRSVYNFSKHTLVLYGGSSFLDVVNGQRDIHIPDFKYRKKVYNSRTTSELIDYYEKFIEKYIDVMNVVDSYLRNSSKILNRFYIGKIIIDESVLGEGENISDIILHAEFETDGEHIKRYWIEDPSFDTSKIIEIMPPHSKTIGQHLGVIAKIEVIEHGNKIGELQVDLSKIDTSVLSYHKYKFVTMV